MKEGCRDKGARIEDRTQEALLDPINQDDGCIVDAAAAIMVTIIPDSMEANNAA